MISLKNFSSLERVSYHLSVSCDGHICSSSFDFCFAKRNQEIFVHDLRIDVELDTIHHFVFEEDHGVVVTNGCLEKSSAILNIPWADDFESWNL